jgi:ferredoxin
MSMRIIASECTACGECAATCPSDAIVEKRGYYSINAVICTECDGVAELPQCLDGCPVGEDCIVYN